MTNIDDVAQTLAEYERLVITSGAKVQIDPPEFSDGGSLTHEALWAPFWFGEQPPKVARATVHRDGIPTTVYAVWDESLPVDTAQAEDGRLWRDIWLAKPVQRFGSFVIRKALARAFREVVGDRIEPDEDAPRVAPPQPVARDWAAEYRAATTVDELYGLRRAARAARENTLELEGIYNAARDELIAAEWAPAETPELSPDELARHVAFFGPDRPEPTDHLPPANRAARRAEARKKGRRS